MNSRKITYRKHLKALEEIAIHMIKTMLTFFNIIKTADDISVVRKMIDVLSETYTDKIEKDKNGFPVEKT